MTIKSALVAGAFTLAMATLPTAPASATPRLDPGLAGAETLPNIEKAHWRHWRHRHWRRYHHWRHWHRWHHRHWHYYY